VDVMLIMESCWGCVLIRIQSGKQTHYECYGTGIYFRNRPYSIVKALEVFKLRPV
jgi:hypothetical protein